MASWSYDKTLDNLWTWHYGHGTFCSESRFAFAKTYTTEQRNYNSPTQCKEVTLFG